MTNLVEIKGKKLFTDTIKIADGVGLEHESVMRLIKEHEHRDLFSDLKSVKLKTGGRPMLYYELDEQQATFLIMLMRNTDVVVDFKEKLTNEFYRQRRVIDALKSQKDNEIWNKVRVDGKKIYWQKTDVIKQFVDYAIAQGSQNAQRYYQNIASMENRALFLLEQKYPNVRDILDTSQLITVATADLIVEKALLEGMRNYLNYKDCFKVAKERVEALASVIGKSPVQNLIGE